MTWLWMATAALAVSVSTALGYLLYRRAARPGQLPEVDLPLDPLELLAATGANPKPMCESLCEWKDYRAEIEQEMRRLQNAEKDLLAHRAYSEAVFHATQAGLMILDADTWQIMDINEAGAQILGCAPDDIIGDSVRRFARNASPRLAASISRGRTVSNLQFVMKDYEGRDVPTIGSVTKMWGQNTNLVVASFLDIGELKAKEAELVAFNDRLAHLMDELQRSKRHVAQSEKLASIGQLAAGVAHEINNPVGFVTSNLGTIQEYAETLTQVLQLYRELEDAEGVERDELRRRIGDLREQEDLQFILDDLSSVLGESMDGVKRVAEIVQNLKSFARSDAPTLEYHDLNDGLEQMIRMTWNELKYHCTVERDFGRIPPVMCHPGQINQVLMNMLVNASHAIGEKGGTITVSSRMRGDEIEIAVADTGCGIAPEVLPRIFDPFFTTKEVGKGTGLGLSISHGIIQDHSGRIEVDSVVGEGTTFRIYLPVSETPATGETGDAKLADTPPDADELAAVFEPSGEEIIG